ncbi:MAG: hypothetical protein AAGC55_31835, partial [Myxococcota bacterium]
MWNWIKELFQRNAQNYLYTPIPPERTDIAGDAAAIAPGERYIRIWLVQMALKRDRSWFSTWHPAVHCVVRLQFGDQPQVEIPYVAGPLNIPDLSDNNLDRVVHLNHQLTPLLPYAGGVVGLSAGLLAMQGDDQLKGFIDTLSSFSSLLNVPQLSATLKVAGPVASGVRNLVADADGDLHLGLQQSFTAAGGGGSNDLRPGYFAVVHATRDQVDPDQLRIENDRLHLGDEPLGGHAFMLFRIEVREERDDYEGLTAIWGPWQKAVNELAKLDETTAETMLRLAIVSAFN